jgi:hypothetical protein
MVNLEDSMEGSETISSHQGAMPSARVANGTAPVSRLNHLAELLRSVTRECEAQGTGLASSVISDPRQYSDDIDDIVEIIEDLEHLSSELAALRLKTAKAA